MQPAQVPVEAGEERVDDLGSLADARRDLAHAGLDDVLQVADELAHLRVGAMVAAELAATGGEGGIDGGLLGSLVERAADAVTMAASAAAALELGFVRLLGALTREGLAGSGAALDMAGEEFGAAASEAERRCAEATGVLRAVGRFAAGSGATSEAAGEAEAMRWDLGLELLALTALGDPGDRRGDDDSGRVAVVDERRLRRDLTGLVAELAVNAPAVLALRRAGGQSDDVTVHHHHDGLVVQLEAAPGESEAAAPAAENRTVVARLEPDEAPPDVADLLTEVLRRLGLTSGEELTFLVVRLPEDREADGGEQVEGARR